MPPGLLQNRLDRDVYQVVRKLETERQESSAGKDSTKNRLTIDLVYTTISRSNSSLARNKKKVLEDAIERVLQLRKQEKAEDARSEEGEGDEAMQDASPLDSPKPKERDGFLLNRQIARSWNLQGRKPEEIAAGTNTGKMTTMPGDIVVESTTSSSTTVTNRLPNGESKPKKRKPAKEEANYMPPSGLSLDDLGGMDEVIWELLHEIGCPIWNPQKYISLGTQPPRGILLHGPPGCGKTKLVNTLASAIGVAFLPVSAPSLIAGMSGESEKQIRDLFDRAKQVAPCIIFLDEIDAIMGKRENAQREMEKRIVAQMLTCLDDLSLESTGGKPVITLAATNRPDSIDPALRRAGRFNTEINIGVPSEDGRAHIFKALLQKQKFSDDIDFRVLARLTPGFVGADLEDVVMKAVSGRLRRDNDEGFSAIISQMDPEEAEHARTTNGGRLKALKFAMTMPEESSAYLEVTQRDILDAVSKVQPSSKREGFTTIPDTTWSQVGALQHVRDELNMAIIQPIEHPEVFREIGCELPSGTLLWGPPGCGKTLLAKAVANQAKANFISVKGPELLNKYVGESERAVRQVFSRARASAPCILFFDEMDSLVPRRSESAETSARVVNMLLTELDGMDRRVGVYVIAATNRPDIIDPAILRPGRLDTRIFVDLPDEDGRVEILQAHLRNAAAPRALHDNELAVLDRVARDPRCHGFSGADLQNLYKTAGKSAARRVLEPGQDGLRCITEHDWEGALEQVMPSVSEKQYKMFLKMSRDAWD